jgi:integral membrane protein (TIGR01906 family)
MWVNLLKFARWTLVPVLPLLIISGAIAFAFNFQPLYEYGFHRYDVSKTTGLENSELAKAADGLIRYFNSNDEYIDLDVQKDGVTFQLFNDREIQHLYDVKGLIRLDYTIFLISLVGTVLVSGIALYQKKLELLVAPMFWGGTATFTLLIVTVAVAASNFDAFFTRFHQLSFANDFWLLDPSKDYLIMLFPGGFWQDASIFIAGLIGAFASAVTILGWKHLEQRLR